MEAVFEKPVAQKKRPAGAGKKPAKAKRPAQTTIQGKAKPADAKAGTKASAKHTAQVNVRIDADLKQRGEAGFAAAGLTPSAAVRLLYEFAAENEQTPENIGKALRVGGEAGDAAEDEAAKAARKAARKAERERRMREFESKLQPIYDMIHENGWDGHSEIDNIPYEQLKAEAYAEKYGIGA